MAKAKVKRKAVWSGNGPNCELLLLMGRNRSFGRVSKNSWGGWSGLVHRDYGGRTCALEQAVEPDRNRAVVKRRVRVMLLAGRG